MLNVKWLTISLTCAVYLDCVSFAVASISSESRQRLIKRELNERSCGVRGDDLPTGSQIVGGQQSAQRWPWMASIALNGFHTCGGSVLDRRHIISAAHCFDGNNDPNVFTVSVNELESRKGLSYKVEKIISHEEYSSPPNFHNDIALLILQNPLPANAIPVCLPEEDAIRDGETLTITGFGTMAEGGRASPTLNEVHGIPYINPNKCNEVMQSMLGQAALVTEKQLCTGDDAGGRGSCQGDSGGPVTHKQADGRWSLVGLVSYSIGCVRPGIPTVHTRLHAYRDWIKNNMLVE